FDALRAAEDVTGVFKAEVPVLDVGIVYRLGMHAQQLNRLAGEDPGEIEQAVVEIAEKDVPGLVLGRRHELDRTARKDLPHQLSLCPLVEDRIFDPWIDFMRMT